jgi:type IV secretion system protein VirB5
MHTKLRRTLGAVTAACLVAVCAPAASVRAQGIPVIDVAALVQLIQQISYWQQQIKGMVSQLNQLQATYGAMTGTRGMQGVLPTSNLARNYLPPDYQQLNNVTNGTSVTYSGLSAQAQQIMTANAVLSSRRLGALTPQQQQIVQDGRRAAALLQVMTQQAYQNTSQRFSALQQLINTIGAAGDAKAISDLQGRIGAEQNMLTNEQTKLQVLYQMTQADQLQQQQRMRELATQQLGQQALLPAVPLP